MLSLESNNPLSISEFISCIKNDLESSYQDVFVQGEISNLSRSTAGHWYFTLKDAKAALSVAVFRFEAMKNPILNKLKDGDLIDIKGEIGVYAARGVFQLIGKKISHAGEGDLFQKYLQLKEKLKMAGLFSADKKLKIPPFSMNIGLITGKKSAAEADFVNILDRRAFKYNLVVAHSIMQGATAAPDIVKQLKALSKVKNLDVIVITRGGGSFEDLFCFNDERLVRFVSDYSIPIISAIGHQVDFTLLDFVADFRCETPSAAAELLTNDQHQLHGRLESLGQILLGKMRNFQQRFQLKIEKLNPQSMLRMIEGKQKYRLQRLNHAYKSLSRKKTINLNEKYFLLDQYIEKILISMQQKNQFYLERLQIYYDKLQILSPTNVLQRGYSIVRLGEKEIIKSSSEFKREMSRNSKQINIQFSDKTINLETLK